MSQDDTPLAVRSDLLNAVMSAPLSGGAVFAAYALADEIDNLVHRRTLDLRSVPEEGVVVEMSAFRLRHTRDDNDNLREALRRLGEVRWSGEDEAGVAFDTRLIAQVKWPDRGRKVRVSLPSEAVKMLGARTLFAKIERVAALYLSGHAARLYGLIADKRRLSRRTDAGWTWWVWDLDEFKEMLGVARSKAYRDWTNMRRRVIEPAVEAINASGVVELRWEPVRNGRAYGQVRFEWRFKAAAKAAETAVENDRHSAARGRKQSSAVAPPLVEDDDDEAAEAWWNSLSSADQEQWQNTVGRTIGEGLFTISRRASDIARDAWRRSKEQP